MGSLQQKAAALVAAFGIGASAGAARQPESDSPTTPETHEALANSGGSPEIALETIPTSRTIAVDTPRVVYSFASTLEGLRFRQRDSDYNARSTSEESLRQPTEFDLKLAHLARLTELAAEIGGKHCHSLYSPQVGSAARVGEEVLPFDVRASEIPLEGGEGLKLEFPIDSTGCDSCNTVTVELRPDDGFSVIVLGGNPPVERAHFLKSGPSSTRELVRADSLSTEVLDRILARTTRYAESLAVIGAQESLRSAGEIVFFLSVRVSRISTSRIGEQVLSKFDLPEKTSFEALFEPPTAGLSDKILRISENLIDGLACAEVDDLGGIASTDSDWTIQKGEPRKSFFDPTAPSANFRFRHRDHASSIEVEITRNQLVIRADDLPVAGVELGQRPIIAGAPEPLEKLLTTLFSKVK
ncbi:MAG: hypothetical protein KDD64_11295 [Bdellovibrionales bacterium]|nr:hypothetical protein [Bdellovibrionales bacterium]